MHSTFQNGKCHLFAEPLGLATLEYGSAPVLLQVQTLIWSFNISHCKNKIEMQVGAEENQQSKCDEIIASHFTGKMFMCQPVSFREGKELLSVQVWSLVISA